MCIIMCVTTTRTTTRTLVAVIIIQSLSALTCCFKTFESIKYTNPHNMVACTLSYKIIIKVI